MLITNQPIEYFLVTISNETGPVVTINRDGTVTIHQEGKAPEAARIFYDALQIEGRTLQERIAERERTLNTALELLDEIRWQWSGDYLWTKWQLTERIDEIRTMVKL